MNEIKCSMPDCLEVFKTVEPVSNKATFLCKFHCVKAPNKIRFQDHQFDKGLKRGKKPDGTGHITRQGSDL